MSGMLLIMLAGGLDFAVVQTKRAGREDRVFPTVAEFQMEAARDRKVLPDLKIIDILALPCGELLLFGFGHRDLVVVFHKNKAVGSSTAGVGSDPQPLAWLNLKPLKYPVPGQLGTPFGYGKAFDYLTRIKQPRENVVVVIPVGIIA